MGNPDPSFLKLGRRSNDYYVEPSGSKCKDIIINKINLKFINLDKEFTKTKDDLLENVKNKLESEKKSREAKQSDINSFDMKIKKFEEVLEKIDLYKKKLENQIKDLYKGE